ncbi:MAG TPA: hypothetical protein VHG89_00340, partial [Verrucomicrobiae bacterium]|nr:hypothetical protein [Verrucomicrobiae bacterium]
MRIFILPGTLNCDNMGDVAMLQVALQRLKGLWPDARLFVLSNCPEKLEFYCPGAEVVSWLGCKRWLDVQSLPRILFPNVRRDVRNKFPLTVSRLLSLVRLAFPSNLHQARPFVEALLNADLVVASGCGLITDAFKINAGRWLDMLGVAIRCGIPTAM